MDEATLDALKKLRDEARTYSIKPKDGHRYDPYWSGQWEALDLAVRVIEGKHTINDCCNSHCSSPMKPWHCYECEELGLDYDASHILEHLDTRDQ